MGRSALKLEKCWQVYFCFFIKRKKCNIYPSSLLIHIVDSTFHHLLRRWSPFLSRTGNASQAFHLWSFCHYYLVYKKAFRFALVILEPRSSIMFSFVPTKWILLSTRQTAVAVCRLSDSSDGQTSDGAHKHAFPYSYIAESTIHQPQAGPPFSPERETFLKLSFS